MRKFFLLILCFINVNCIAQINKATNYGPNSELYKGKRLVLIQRPSSDKQPLNYELKNLYLYPLSKKKDDQTSLYYKDLGTDTLVVTDVQKNAEKGYGLPVDYLFMKDLRTAKTYLYKYTMADFGFYFANTTPIKYSDVSLKAEIISTTDEFTNTKTFFTNPIKNAIIYKYIRPNSNPEYFLFLKTLGDTPIPPSKGVIILLKDGTKLNFPSADVEAKVSKLHIQSFPYEYFSWVKLNTDDIDKLKKSDISKYRLFAFDEELSEMDSARTSALIKLISEIN